MNNPFIHEAATNLDEDTISDIFIDNEQSSLIQTQKNIFIIGNRGSGKSMLLKYNSFHLQFNKNKNLNNIGIYISCQTPLFHKKEYELIEDEFKSSIISEHILVLSMATELLKNLSSFKDDLFDSNEINSINEDIEFYFDIENSKENILDKLYKTLKKDLIKTQESLNNNPEKFFDKAKTYSSLIIPLLEIFQNTSKLKNSHFMFMIDDGQMLSKFQQIALSSWISFRNTKSVSFKVAITSKKDFLFYTNNDSSILENHDFVTLDLEKDMFSGSSSFINFAKKIIEKRLELSGFKNSNINDFFPIDTEFEKKLEEIKNKFIKGEYPEQKDKDNLFRQKNVSKYKRAIYFRLAYENSKGNLPRSAYTGFEVLANLSTGVIRNLLVPCSLMFEKEKEKSGNVKFISSTVQYESIKDVSQNLWDDISNLQTQQLNCTEEDTKKLKMFFDNFASKLKHKLLDSTSTEKQILSFTIEKLEDSKYRKKIEHVLNIAIKAGMIYTRVGADKSGGRTIWYTPNRLFWPSRGLDPVGQNGRMNIIPEDFITMLDKKIDLKNINQTTKQKGLFDE